jgi:hypothetical protein
MSASIQFSLVVDGAASNPSRPGTQIVVTLSVLQGFVQTPFGPSPQFGQTFPMPADSIMSDGTYNATYIDVDPSFQWWWLTAVIPGGTWSTGNWNDSTNCVIPPLLGYGPIYVIDNKTTVLLPFHGLLTPHVILKSPKGERIVPPRALPPEMGGPAVQPH